MVTYIENLGREENCPRCGKLFSPTSEWAWKYRDVKICSYHCMRALEKVDPAILEGDARRREVKAGIAPPARSGRLTVQEKKTAQEMWENGRSLKEIGFELGRSTYCIRKLLASLNLRKPQTKHGPSPIRESREEVERLLNAGLKQCEVARRLNVSEQTLSRYLSRWRL